MTLKESDPEHRTKHLYSVIRYVPDVARAEFRNIGLMVENAEGTRRSYRVQTDIKLPKPGLNYSALSAIEEDARFDLHTLHKKHHTRIIQYSYPLPLLAKSVSEGIDLMWERLIAESSLMIRCSCADPYQQPPSQKGETYVI